MLPDFNRLHVFYHVYLHQSSTRAAKILHITQSGVSQQLKKLEEELKCPLFTRMNRRLIPTAAGDRLFLVVQHFVVDLEQGVRELRVGQESPSGLLRIGTPEEFGKRYLPSIMASFGRKFPKVSFQLKLGGPVLLLEQLAAGKLDLIYGDILPISLDGQSGQNSIESTPLIRERFLLVCSSTYQERWQVKNDYDQLSELDYIGYKNDIGLFRSWFELNFHKSPQKLKLSLVADNTEVIIQGLLNDIGLAVIVSHFITDHLQSGRLVAIKPQDKQLENIIASFRCRQRQSTVTEKIFHQHLLESLQQLPGLDLYPGEEKKDGQMG